MSKPVKEMLRREIVRRLKEVQDLAVVSVTGIGGVANNKLRGDLRGAGIRVMIVRNALARQAFDELGLAKAASLLDGPCALAYGGESVVDMVRLMMDKAKTVPQLKVKGALMDGEVFGPERVDELSKYPTRPEALGRLAAVLLSPGGKLVSAAMGPGRIIGSILKAIEEKAPKPVEAADEEPKTEGPVEGKAAESPAEGPAAGTTEGPAA
jgi:large subunit ribosomal protein L10